MQPKHPRDSETIMSELMMPQHANIMGNVFGGVILSLVDRVAAVAAIRHASKPCVQSRGMPTLRGRIVIRTAEVASAVIRPA